MYGYTRDEFLAMKISDLSAEKTQTKISIEKALKNGDHDTWHKQKNIERYLKGYRKTLDTSKGVVLFKTKTKFYFN